MKKYRIVILSSLIALSTIACTTGNSVKQEIKTTEQVEGKSLHKENCTKCHNSSVYIKADRKIKSLDSLAKRVSACDANIGSGLEPEEIKAITTFLNSEYYKF